jgi:hypothetical protein
VARKKKKGDFSSQRALGEEEVLALLEMTGASGEKMKSRSLTAICDNPCARLPRASAPLGSG